MYAVGGAGSDGGGNLNMVERYDPRSNRWTSLKPMSVARHGLGTCVIDGQLYAVGGAGGGQNEVERYDPRTDTWTTLKPMPTSRRYLGVCAL